MAFTEYPDYDATGLARLIRDKKISAAEALLQLGNAGDRAMLARALA